MAYFFQLPLVTDLTIDQQMALAETKPIAISGGAGTGKTVVSLWRHIQNIEVLKKTSIIVTFTKSLHSYILNSSKSLSKEAYKYVWTSFVIYSHTGNWRVDEIIVDEAQDLAFQHLADIKNYATLISYGADFNQQLYQNKINYQEIKSLFPENTEYDLQQNFRNSYYILNFTKAILPNMFINQSTLDELYDSNKGIKPIMFITDNFDNEIAKIIEIINEFSSETHNIVILLPFGDGAYDYIESVDRYYDALYQKKINCSKYYNKMNIDDIYINNVHVTTFKSAKGLEFDTVIIPQLNKAQNNISNTYTVKQEDYYVAFTRAKRNLYLISHNVLDFIDNSTVDIEYLDARR